MRVLLESPLRIRDVHPIERAERRALGVTPGDTAVMHQNLGELHADLEVRGEGGHGILKHHGELRSANPVELVGGQPQDFLILEQGAAGYVRAARQQSHHSHEKLGLSGAGLAHHPEAFVCPHRQ